MLESILAIMAMALLYTLALSFTILFLLVRHLQAPKAPVDKAPFPKGPALIPFLGNLHQIPIRKSFLAFTAWSRSTETSTTDGLVGLRLGPSARAVVLGKWTHVRDLFDARGRGTLYADRPYFPTADYVIPNPPGTDLHLVFARDGAKWRRARRTIVEFLSARQLEKLKDVQDAESSQMMWEFLQFGTSGEEGDDVEGVRAYHRYAMRYFGAVILASVFGLRGKDSGPQSRVTRFFAVQNEWASMLTQGSTPPLDVFPWLKYIPEFLTPWKGWRSRTDSLKQRQSSLYHELFAETKARLQAGKGRESFLARMVEAQKVAVDLGRDKDIYTQLELDYIGGFLMEGGADTTAMAFETFLLAMVSYPDVQKHAQKEVDAISGPDEVPHIADGEKLPFLKACFLEVSLTQPSLPPDTRPVALADLCFLRRRCVGGRLFPWPSLTRTQQTMCIKGSPFPRERPSYPIFGLSAMIPTSTRTQNHSTHTVTLPTPLVSEPTMETWRAPKTEMTNQDWTQRLWRQLKCRFQAGDRRTPLGLGAESAQAVGWRKTVC